MNKTHKDGCSKDNSGNDDCCGGNQCNPFSSQCPVCAATGVITPKYQLPDGGFDNYIRSKYFSYYHFTISNYQSDILHPPRAV
jgi:hypothetical protein